MVATPARFSQGSASGVGESLLPSLKRVLTAAGYEPEVLDEVRRLGQFLPAEEVVAAAEGVRRGPVRLATLVRLLALGATVSRAQARRALHPLSLEDLASAGIVEADGPGVRAPVRVLAYEGLLLIGDRVEIESRDMVRALYGASSTNSAALTPRDPARSMLDIGTGSGVQALLASRHCEHVVGIDVNPRAIEFARNNAQMNCVANATWHVGDYFEPVDGERFDLIVGNPPYVVSPDRDFTYRDSDRDGDELMAGLCRDVSEHLEEGGLGILVCEWPHATEADWAAAPRRWTTAGGCDSIVVCGSTNDPFDHALGWNRPPNRRLAPAELNRVITRWHTHCRQTGIGAISSGVVVLRRRERGRRWSLVARVDARQGDHAARQVHRIIAGNDVLAESDLLDRRFAVPEGLRISQPLERRDSAWVTRAAHASAPGELGVTAAIDPATLDAVFRCNGAKTLGELVAGDPRCGQVEVAVRELLSRGLLDVVA